MRDSTNFPLPLITANIVNEQKYFLTKRRHFLIIKFVEIKNKGKQYNELKEILQNLIQI